VTNKPKRRKPGVLLPNTNQKASPAEEYVRNLDGEFYLLSEVAEIVGVTKNTLRRLVTNKEKRVKAPSYTGALGGMNIYIFSRADIEEIKEYYHSRYENFAGPEAKLPPGRPKARKV